jgi:DNA-directed RNA polymerase specialized sigma subunit
MKEYYKFLTSVLQAKAKKQHPELESGSAEQPTGYKETDTELLSLILEWKQSKDKKILTKILKKVEPTLRAATLAYMGEVNPTNLGYAKILAIEALERYDPRTAKFKNYLLVHLQGLKRIGGRLANIIYVKERHWLDYQKILSAAQQLKEELGRDPTDEEIAERTGYSVEYIVKLRTEIGKTYSQGQILQQQSEEDSSLPAPTTTIETIDPYKLIYYDSTEEEKYVLEYWFGVNNKERKTKQEIAAELKISKARLNQIIESIEARVNEIQGLSASLTQEYLQSQTQTLPAKPPDQGQGAAFRINNNRDLLMQLINIHKQFYPDKPKLTQKELPIPSTPTPVPAPKFEGSDIKSDNIWSYMDE